MIEPKWLNVAGLVLNIVGTLIITAGIVVSKKRAVDVGVMRLAGETLEENLQLPAVVDRLRQSRLAKWGLGLPSGDSFSNYLQRCADDRRAPTPARTGFEEGRVGQRFSSSRGVQEPNRFVGWLERTTYGMAGIDS